MSIKDKVRKKFLLLRKSKYFIFDDDIFKPLINLIKLKKKRKISLYYPSNFEADTLKLFKILEKDKKLHTSLPSISSKYTIDNLVRYDWLPLWLTKTQGIKIFERQNATNIQAICKNNFFKPLVVLSSAVPSTNAEVQAAKKANLKIFI